MQEYDIKASKFNGVDTVDFLINLATDIYNLVPDISFKPKNMNNWGVDKNTYPDGVCESIQVFHKNDLNNHIGTLEVSNYYRASDKPKYGITSINIDNGRQVYGYNRNEGQHKYSIHAKNIVKIAKKAFKPFTFEQIADMAKNNFSQNVDSLRHNLAWEVRQNTSHDIDIFKDDLFDLFESGHKFKSEKVQNIMAYLVQNKAKIDKYMNYNPDHYFVLVKDDMVQYRLNSSKDKEPITLPNKDALPDDIKGKLFVLDITDKQDFVEDVGLKENDGAYWIIA